MKKLLLNKIDKVEESPLSQADKQLLIAKRNRKLRFLLLSYAPLVLVLLIVFINGLSLVYRDRNSFQRHEITDEDVSRFGAVAPFVCGFFFLMLTGYFLKMYLEGVAPIVKDIKGNKKLLATIKTEKSDMGAFGRYFIATPIKDRRHIAIQKDDFFWLVEQEPLIFEVAPNSAELFKILSKEKNVVFL